jgi:hypothetical protein
MVHTQNVESYNNKKKLRIKELKGLKEEAREWFCYEFMWLNNFKQECFEKSIDLIKI